jgi:primosomal protein N' (replication factor Y) (superfamily II helicase)
MPLEATQATLDLAPVSLPGDIGRLVEVAVDAAGGGGRRTYTYRVPEALADLVVGEAVLVEFGRRQALGIVVGEAIADPSIAARPLTDRVRADGPLLPPLSLGLARWIAETYLAPASLVIRSFLPPGLLERLELVAELAPPRDGSAGSAPELRDDEPDEPADAAEDAAILDQLAARPRTARELSSAEGRAQLLRRLHALAASGRITLDWTLTAAGAGPRFERHVRLTEPGRAAAAALVDGRKATGRLLGPRQVALLAELAELAASAAGDRQTDPAASELAARHGQGTVAGLVRRGLLEIAVERHERLPLAHRPAGRRGARPPDAAFTSAQAEAIGIVRKAIAERDPTPLLLDGVTGAGKTAIYVEAIIAALETGRPALVLVPEISLALPLVDRLRADVSAEAALIHSGLAPGERADEWRRIRAGGVQVVVGTRLAIGAPLAEIGVVIVDEEHDGAYKSDRTPRLQARDTAIELGRRAGAAVILGSATPAVETIGRARLGRYRRVVLPTRPTGAPPRVEVVDLRAELADGNRGLLSGRLATALGALDVTTRERAILVINRRGTASAVICRDCGTAQACPECARPLVFHQAGMTLRCHHCGRASPMATRCPTCGSPRIRYLGGGTQRVEAEVRARFPRLRVGRLDRDVAERREAAERVVTAFTDGRLDVLVGTSLVAKGLDIPEVTLVGVVSADVALNLPDERAAERTYQLLAQAVGRAGRGDMPGLAIIQSYQPEHPAIQAVARGDPAAFYDAELAARERWSAPPFGRYVKLTVGLPDAAAAEREAQAMADRLRAIAADRGEPVEVIGPAPAYIARRAERWRWNVVLRGPNPASILDAGLEAPWSVDVDPESLL